MWSSLETEVGVELWLYKEVFNVEMKYELGEKLQI